MLYRTTRTLKNTIENWFEEWKDAVEISPKVDSTYDQERPSERIEVLECDSMMRTISEDKGR